MNGTIAFIIAFIPYIILFIVAAFIFNVIFQVKKNSDIQIEQNKQILSLLEKLDTKD